ncbi:MAG: DUF488 family protein [Acidimicrobiales bacterium]
MAAQGIDVVRSQLPILSIGHSNTAFSVFASRLSAADRDVVVDVRSVPYASYAKHFSRDQLPGLLTEAGFRYLYLGEELGAGFNRPGESDDALASRISRGIDRVQAGAERYRIALMCGEVRPEGCHRRHLLGGELMTRGYDLGHILGDGTIVLQSELDEADRQSRPQLDLPL